ncbi:ATP-binding protein, partial [Bacillus cereus group sp. Bce025]
MNISAQEEHFGQVVSISGMDIIVEMKQELLKSNLEQRIVGDGQTVLKLFVGTVGDIFLIGDPATDAFHYAIFEEVKLVSEVEDQEKTGAPYIISSKKQKAIAIAKIIGYQDQRIKEKLSFRRGIGHYPKFNSKCYLLTS